MKYLVALFCLLATPALAADIQVGPTHTIRYLKEAVEISEPGDRLLLDCEDGREYNIGFLPKIVHDLTIECVGGRGDLWPWRCQDQIQNPCEKIRHSPRNGKAAFVVGTPQSYVTLTLRNIECSFVLVTDGNGACVRLEYGKLVMDGVYCHHNQNCVLTRSAKQDGKRVYDQNVLEIRNSHIVNHGNNAGSSHGLYANRCALLIAVDSTFAGVNEGHGLKSRCAINVIYNNTFTSDARTPFTPDDELACDNPAAQLYCSVIYLLDLPNGGDAWILKNTFVQEEWSSSQQNMIHVCGERVSRNSSRSGTIRIRDNEFINHRSPGHILLHHCTPNWDPSVRVKVHFVDNRVCGATGLFRGHAVGQVVEIGTEFC